MCSYGVGHIQVYTDLMLLNRQELSAGTILNANERAIFNNNKATGLHSSPAYNTKDINLL